MNIDLSDVPPELGEAVVAGLEAAGAFPVDGPGPSQGPRELGDVVVCPEECSDLREAVVHGVLHLCGYDHEVDDGEMLALQAKAMARLRDR